jgi:hypothetical protein
MCLHGMHAVWHLICDGPDFMLAAAGSLPHHQRPASIYSAPAVCNGAPATMPCCPPPPRRFMDLGFGELVLQRLADAQLPSDFIPPACSCLRSFTSADDERPIACRAFLHARLLAKQHNALKVLLAVLRRVGGEQPQLCAALLATVKQIAANEEICKEFSDDGGVLCCLELTTVAGGADVEVARCGCGALRQLANSDSVKQLLAEHGALDMIARWVGGWLRCARWWWLGHAGAGVACWWWVCCSPTFWAICS